MTFHSILGRTPYGFQPSEIVYPSYFKDLNLDQVTSCILEKWDDYDLEKYFYYPVWDKETLLFRRGVFLDLADDALRSVFRDFSMKLKKSQQYLHYREELLEKRASSPEKKSGVSISSKTASEIKCRHFLADAAECYTSAVFGLFHALEPYHFSSDGLSSFFSFLKEYCESPSLEALCRDLEDLRRKLGTLTFRMELSGTKVTLHDDYETFDARKEMTETCGLTVSPKKHDMKSPFTNILELEDFEGLLLSMLKGQHKDVFQKLEEFETAHPLFFEPLLSQFEEEIQVYLSVWEFISSMQSYGFSFSCPVISDPESMMLPKEHHPAPSAETSSVENAQKDDRSIPTMPDRNDAFFLLEDAYDLALACKHCFSPEKVIKNDGYLLPNEHFFVITGPNQGGKTTFARAVGQAVYFHQMGFSVPGKKAVLPVFSSIFTHFLAEEDVASGTGKLKEELKRLSPMLHAEAKNGFVILNELFTTATSYDATIMGKRILRAFMEKGFSGIYVTHIQELAAPQDGIVSMTAQVDADECTRTYRLVRAKAKGIAYAQTIAGTYRLSREEILKRVKE